MALGKTYFIEKYKNFTNEELNKSLNELNEFLNSEQLKKMREEEIKEGIDDTNCIENVKTEIDAIKEIIAEKSGDIDSIIQYVIGNNDPFWNIPVKVIVSKIINMNDGDKTSIRELVEENYSESQLKDIYLCVNRVCKKLNINLDFHGEDGSKIDGDYTTMMFTKKRIAVCPICKNRLTFMMPDGKTLYCNPCNKFFINENGVAGNETSSPYENKDVFY